jgi:hypothetical protein
MSQQKKSQRQCRAESAAQPEQTPRGHNIRVILSEMLLAYQRSTHTRATLLSFALQLIAKVKHYAEVLLRATLCINLLYLEVS